VREFKMERINNYVFFYDEISWRNRRPIQVLKEVEEKLFL
jgi:hypothetical protein